MRVLHFILRVPWELDRLGKPRFDAELHQDRAAAGLQNPPELRHEADGSQIEDEVLRDLRTQRERGAADPIQRLLVQRRNTFAGFHFRLVNFTGVMSARFSLSTTRSTLASRRGSCSALAWRAAAAHPPSCPMASWVFRNGRVMSTKT